MWIQVPGGSESHRTEGFADRGARGEDVRVEAAQASAYRTVRVGEPINHRDHFGCDQITRRPKLAPQSIRVQTSSTGSKGSTTSGWDDVTDMLDSSLSKSATKGKFERAVAGIDPTERMDVPGSSGPVQRDHDPITHRATGSTPSVAAIVEVEFVFVQAERPSVALVKIGQR